MLFKTDGYNISRETRYFVTLGIRLRRNVNLHGDFRNISPVANRHIRIQIITVFNNIQLPRYRRVGTINLHRVSGYLRIGIVRLAHVLFITNGYARLREYQVHLSIIERIYFVIVDIQRTEFRPNIRPIKLTVFYTDNLNIVFTCSRNIPFVYKVDIHAF